MPGLHIDSRWEPHIPGALQMNDFLRQMGDVIPPMDTPEQIAAARVIPAAFTAQELALPMESRTIPGPAGDLRVRVAVPSSVRAVYLDIHGGGFCLGWPEQKDASNARLAVAADVAVVSVDYRLAPEDPYPAGLDDCTAAACWLIDHAEAEFGASTLFIGGDSAGGNLAVLVAARLREQGVIDRVAGLNLLYGAYDLSGTPSSRNRGDDALILTAQASRQFHARYLPGMDPEQVRAPEVSPLFADLRGLPPALFCVGMIDPLLDDSLFMSARWQAAGGDSQLYVVPESPHGFAAFPSPMATEAEQLQEEWVRERLDAFEKQD